MDKDNWLKPAAKERLYISMKHSIDELKHYPGPGGEGAEATQETQEAAPAENAAAAE